MDRRLLAAAALALLLPACGGDDGDSGSSPPPTTTGTPSSAGPSLSGTASPAFVGKLVRVFVAGGKVTNKVERRQEVRRGENVRIEVTSDRANELHVHGYDLKADLKPNVRTVVEFKASNPGSFEVELEDPKLVLFELQVR